MATTNGLVLCGWRRGASCDVHLWYTDGKGGVEVYQKFVNETGVAMNHFEVGCVL